MPWTEGDKPLDAAESQELFEAIREISLDQMAEGLKKLGISDQDIQKARAQCIAQNTDKPFVELFKTAIKH